MNYFKAIIFSLLFLSPLTSLQAKTLPPTKEYNVLSLSSAIIDHYFFISDDQLKFMANEKGTWTPIDHETLSRILQKNTGAAKTIPGGSGANVLKGFCHLGGKCAVIGKVGSDDKGEFYVKRLKEQGITPLMQQGALPTGQAVCLITPDGERTFRSYLGASHSLSDLKFDPEVFKKADLYHIEGYQLVDPDLVIKTLKIAKKAGTLISMDLANIEIVRRNKEFIHNILEKYVDIIFCNEKESEALTGLSASEACDKLSAFCKVAVVTMSERGSWVRSGNEKVFMEAFAANAIDSTGAGDLYAGGFLYGYLNEMPLNECAWLGSLLASYVVRRIGAEIPEPIWEEIRSIISKSDKAFD